MSIGKNGIFLWKENEDGVSLLRMYGEMPEIEVPEVIESRPVTEIGDYCFSGSEHLPNGGVRQSVWGSRTEGLHGICGKFIKKVSLPHTVKRIGSYAFYGCSNMETLTLTESVKQIGSDAFLNCICLHQLYFFCSVYQKTCLKQILAQISWNIEVIFRDTKRQEEARLFYPEYFEVYDEVGPAHIFELNLTGEGFRARQCIKDGIVVFSEYDAVFPQACVEEAEKVLIQMAMDRLLYPVGLLEEKKRQYEAYIREKREIVCIESVLKRNLEALHFLVREKILDLSMIGQAAEQAAALGWPEGAASFIRWRGEYFKDGFTKRYEF